MEPVTCRIPGFPTRRPAPGDAPAWGSASPSRSRHFQRWGPKPAKASSLATRSSLAARRAASPPLTGPLVFFFPPNICPSWSSDSGSGDPQPEGLGADFFGCPGRQFGGLGLSQRWGRRLAPPPSGERGEVCPRRKVPQGQPCQKSTHCPLAPDFALEGEQAPRLQPGVCGVCVFVCPSLVRGPCPLRGAGNNLEATET